MKNTEELIEYIPDLLISEYDYELPDEKIASFPLSDRSSSKLLYANLRLKKISEYQFTDIDSLIPSGSLLVMNKTKVIAARIKAIKPGGGKAEILCVRPLHPGTEPQTALSAKGECIWECIIGGSRINDGTILRPEGGESGLEATILNKNGNIADVKFTWAGENSFAEILELMGSTPLPPYIKREATKEDKVNYQTVYADADGSIAAPTAGLHFTDEVLKSLISKGVETTELTLHVGPGTFVPVDSETTSGHRMHREQVFISYDTIQAISDQIGMFSPRIIATGTTSLRTLESLYWHGAKLMLKLNDGNKMDINQYEPYYLEKEFKLPEPKAALETILSRMRGDGAVVLEGDTSLFIMPGFKFRIVNGLITNFHLPKSTLILLVAAFAGNEFWKDIYRYALDNNFRFLSYGDSSFLMK
jgi:S-adenosylmethionine:tRNA ribosyltransferase-isomerase